MAKQPEAATPPVFSRRDFLWVGGLTVAAAAFAGLSPVRMEDPPNTWSAEWKQRHGVSITGEEIPFNLDGRPLAAAANELSFLETLHIIDGKLQPGAVVDFLRTYPLRIALHRTRPFAIASYDESIRFTHPGFAFSTFFLKEYAEAIISNSPAQLRRVDKVVLHELRHLFQDAALNFQLRAEFALYMGLTIATGTSALAILDNRGRRLRLTRPEQREKINWGNLIYSTLAMLTVSTASRTVSPAETDAYSASEGLLDWPELAHLRGRYFGFQFLPDRNHK